MPEIPWRIKPPERTWTWHLRWAAVVLACYVGIAYMCHGFRHPELTEVQRFFEFWDAMAWR